MIMNNHLNHFLFNSAPKYEGEELQDLGFLQKLFKHMKMCFGKFSLN